ncbi:hypothetical protein BLL42_26050 [Pseudomonas frederiksbergensis]|uniref:Uncharacterized protein n=1 Tax=Pseudomonas frederiksbergensis TaxID=104087 RepID=A0A1J0ESQ0_9PSED|nr:hypothetical protein [Pseudomonas frederiksbergensis]APC18995.1 hypothetical protein BLL42_26050 [Pseudomonas frederiksbergensis]
MSAPVATFKTNSQSCSVQDVTLKCDKLWTMGQQEAINRLSVPEKSVFSKSTKMVLVSDFGARAARIAAAYAEFYLERGEDGKPDLKGRFYWMGLAAFASKQVKCGLDFIPAEPYLTIGVPPIGQPPLRIGKKGLGKGNFWLFQDIFVWHWFYKKHPQQFDECAPVRNAKSCDAQVQMNIDQLPWADEALPVLKNLALTPDVKKGFERIKESESTSDPATKRNLQLKSLLAIADHEQRRILQPLIYNEFFFQATLKAQAAFEWAPFVPVRVAAFSTACDVDDKELRVQMDKGNLYSESDRMEFIGKIAAQYHKLMGFKKDYMEEQIETIATWNNAV